MSKGLTARIRAELALGPVTTHELAERLGETVDAVSSLLIQLKNRTGGVLVYDHKPTRYVASGWLRPNPPKKLRPERAPSPGVNLAGPITVGRGSKWGAGLA